jgi:hypothetical protein
VRIRDNDDAARHAFSLSFEREESPYLRRTSLVTR